MSGIVQVGGVALASHDSVSDKVSLDSGVVFPAGHIIYVDTTAFTATGAGSDPGTTWTATSLSITVPSATVALCSKIYVSVSNAFQVSKLSAGTMASFRIALTSPSGSTIARANRLGNDGNDHNEFEFIGINGLDESLGSGDHIYQLQYSDAESKCGVIYYHGVDTASISNITVMGVV